MRRCSIVARLGVLASVGLLTVASRPAPAAASTGPVMQEETTARELAAALLAALQNGSSDPLTEHLPTADDIQLVVGARTDLSHFERSGLIEALIRELPRQHAEITRNLHATLEQLMASGVTARQLELAGVEPPAGERSSPHDPSGPFDVDVLVSAAGTTYRARLHCRWTPRGWVIFDIEPELQVE